MERMVAAYFMLSVEATKHFFVASSTMAFMASLSFGGVLASKMVVKMDLFLQ